MSTQLSELIRHIAARAASQEVTVREVLDGCETTATPADLLHLLDTERRRQGLRKYELASLCGISASMFSRLTSAKSSENMTIGALLMIAVALGLLDSREVPSVSANGAGQAPRRKVKKRAKKRARSASPSLARRDGPVSTDPPEERSRPAASPDDYATIGLREAALILDAQLSGLVDLANKRLLPGTVWEDDAWRISPLALTNIIKEAKKTGFQPQEGVSELSRRLDAVEKANEELKGQIKLIDSVRGLVAQSRQGGNAPDSRSTVLEYLPTLMPSLFKSKEPITMGDFLRAFPEASDLSVDFLASVLMFPVPSKEFLIRFSDDWSRLYEIIKERRDSETVSSEKAKPE